MNPIVKQAIDFTNVYKQYKDAPLPIREAMCYQAQYPALLTPVKAEDLFAGRGSIGRITYMGSVWWMGTPAHTPEFPVEGKQGGYCFDFTAKYSPNFSTEERAQLSELHNFWLHETSMSKTHAHTKCRDGVGFLFANDLDKLVSKGFPGLKQDVAAMPDGDFKTGLLLVLETMIDVCQYYKTCAQEVGNDFVAKNLEAIINHAPKTLAEALQLILIFELLTHEKHYELCRPDVALGDIYTHQLENGELSEEEAVKLLCGFYQMIFEYGEKTVCRFIMGGKYRRNPKNADNFIIPALKAEAQHKKVIPQVSIRHYKGFDPTILKLAYDTINETGTFPTLYNDDAIIPGVAEAFDVSYEDAKKYYPLGCGEFILAHHSPAILIAGWDVPRMADTAMRGSNATTYDELYSAVLAQMQLEANALAEYHMLVCKKHNEDSAFLAGSLLTYDCIERNKPLFDSGVRYNGACVMAHGFSNAADGLAAIKKLVFEEKKYTLQEIITALNANFVGYETLHNDLKNVPKFGNDNDATDSIIVRLWKDMSIAAKKAGKEVGFEFFTVSSVNPGGYWMGWGMGATADGRLAQQAYAIGNAPTAGVDKSGLTAMMNSVLKTDPANGGSVTNIKLSREFFTKERVKFEALFDTYWASGGLQANITIVSKGDLEAAMKEPEKYPHLIVRIGGWSARFIDLDDFTQKEILKRTLH